ncbi:MAG: hypothetical protein J3K34DRAFT_521472 [Monoraphidium minutum]|nr:MAG: hypothetical protein J3K34DRAFT_521472 [Monoraphidium minutum]
MGRGVDARPAAGAAAGAAGVPACGGTANFAPEHGGDAAAEALSILAQVAELQQRLSLAPHGSPLLALPDVAALMGHQLGLDLVAIWGLTSTSGGHQRAVLLAAHGAAAGTLQRGAGVVPAAAGKGGPALGAACSFLLADAADPDQAAAAPPGVLALHRACGLRSFAQLPIGHPSAPLGVLLTARAAPAPAAGAGGEWWRVWLQAAAGVPLPHARDPQVAAACDLLAALSDQEDPLAAASVLLRATRRFLLKACGLRMSARLALLQPGCPDALLLELPRGGGGGAGSSGGGGEQLSGPVVAAGDAAGGVVASQMDLSNTLLASALARQQARFVKDCGHYMQSCRDIARDVFSRASDLVASVVVVPLIGPGGAPLGGLYLAAETPCSFENIQGVLLGLIHAMAPSLERIFRGRTEELAAQAAKQMRRRGSRAALTWTSASSDLLPALAGGGAPGGAAPPGSGCGGSVGSASCGSDGPDATVRLSPSSKGRRSSQRLNTEAMLQVLQQEVRRNRGQGAAVAAEGALRGLTLCEVVGRGGFGRVYRGRWQKSAAAVKVLYARQEEREALKDAVEMAVLSMVQHPNIVALYAALTDMVEAAAPDGADGGSFGSVGGGSVGGPGSSLGGGGGGDGVGAGLRFRRLRPEEDAGEGCPVVNILVLEFCDRGSLRDALRAGAFHRALPGGGTVVHVAALVEVLMDVACALQYLHSMHIVHGDVKASNVLLKSDASRPRGYVPKLADFGLAKVLAEGGAPPNLDGAGTLTHLAPEMLAAGAPVTPAVDAYAFGVTMWELYCRQAPYTGLTKDAIAARARAGGRPEFPPAAPPHYVSLARACWHPDPARRPSFGAITAHLEAAAQAMGLPPAGDAPAAPPPRAAPPAAPGAPARPALPAPGAPRPSAPLALAANPTAAPLRM